MSLTKTMPITSQWKMGSDYTIIDLLNLPQQEAISFLPDYKGFLVTTEYKKKFKKAPILQVSCTSFLKK